MKLSSFTNFLIIIFALILGGYSFWFGAITYFSETQLSSAKQNRELGEFEQALANINQAIKLFPTNALFYKEQATIYYYHKPTKANFVAPAAIEKAIALNPQKGDFYYTLGAIHSTFGQNAKAEFAFENALALQKDHMSYRLGMAKLYLLDKRWDEGFHLYYETLTLAPKSRLQKEAATQFFLIAKQLSKQLNRDELIYLWLRVLNLPLQDTDAEQVLKIIVRIGDSFIENENPSKAFTIYEQAISLNPHHISARNELLTQMLNIAHEFRKSQEYVKASEAYERILAQLPAENGELLEQRYRLAALLNLGISKRRLNYLVEAAKMFEEIINLIPPESDKGFERNHRKVALQQLINLQNNVQ